MREKIIRWLGLFLAIIYSYVIYYEVNGALDFLFYSTTIILLLITGVATVFLYGYKKRLFWIFFILITVGFIIFFAIAIWFALTFSFEVGEL